ncbi:MAG: accessory factor UbiK family protein [Acetobacteraceae bacterium]|nr:accessory factor UbiK family protein [Acetobacteraceae bacterium]MBV8523804.1 accessory factor UbiK family protein [Acetobacteraceae bacterium]MBV8589256.1 accessory factor UbiK family protein [Acetobacteraceae bacterium]
MPDRPRFFDDLAGVAGGAFSALAGLREELDAVIRSGVDEALRRLDLVRKSDLEALQELATNARTGQETAELKLADLQSKLEALESRITALETAQANARALATREGGSLG